MVKFILLNPNGDCEDASIHLKGKDAQKTIDQILKKKVDNPEYTEGSKLTKNIGIVEVQIKNKGEASVKLEEIAQWKLSEEYKLIGYGFKEKQTKKKSNSKSQNDKSILVNNHELPPCKNGDQTYFGDILIFKINEKNMILDYTSDEYSNDYQDLFIKDEFNDSEEEDNVDGFDDEDESEFGEEEEDAEEVDDIEIDDDAGDIDDSDDIDYGDDEDEECDEEMDDEEIDEEDDDDGLEDVSSNINNKKNKKKTKEITDEPTEEVLEVQPLSIEEEDDIIDDDNELNNMVDTRKDIVNIFENLLKDAKMSERIEESIFKNVLKLAKQRRVLRKWDNPIFFKMYINKTRSIYTNLKQDSYVKNVKLAQNIKNKKFDIDNIGNMTYQELYPEHWKKLLDDKFKREKVMYEEKEEAMTDMFKCGRCKSRKCTYYELQTRSADEGMTTFITCINCGNRWKQ